MPNPFAKSMLGRNAEPPGEFAGEIEPSCLISCTHSGPMGGLSAAGRQPRRYKG